MHQGAEQNAAGAAVPDTTAAQHDARSNAAELPEHDARCTTGHACQSTTEQHAEHVSSHPHVAWALYQGPAQAMAVS